MKKMLLTAMLVSMISFGVNINCHAQENVGMVVFDVNPCWTGASSNVKTEIKDVNGTIERVYFDFTNSAAYTQAFALVASDGYAIYGPSTNTTTDVTLHAPRVTQTDSSGTALYTYTPCFDTGGVVKTVYTNAIYRPLKVSGLKLKHWGANVTNVPFRVYVTYSKAE